MEIKRVNIGKEIEKMVNLKLGNSSEFARKIGKLRQNLKTQIYEKNSIDTDLLLLISEALEFNFFDLYKTNEKKDITKNKNVMKCKIELELEEHEIEQYRIKEILKNKVK